MLKNISLIILKRVILLFLDALSLKVTSLFFIKNFLNIIQSKGGEDLEDDDWDDEDWEDEELDKNKWDEDDEEW